MSAFCEPDTQTSRCQASVFSSVAPRPLIASTTRIAGVFATTADRLDVVDDTVEVSLNGRRRP